MKLAGGYFKKILYVDLASGTIESKPLSDTFALKYVGGRGFGAKLVWDNLMAGPEGPAMEAFAPGNLIVVAPGPLSGLFLPASGKTAFVSLSPATGGYADSNMGGSFGVELRQAGYDALAITGKAETLSYLWVDDGTAKIVPCKKLRGKSCLDTEGVIRKELDDADVKIASIGVAGENLVRFACISADWGRQAGRTGMGAVLGSKNLKAIAVRGAKDLPVADVPRLREVSERSFETLRSHPLFDLWQQQGLMSVVEYVNDRGVMPTYNFQDGRFARTHLVNGTIMEDDYKIGDAACFACPMCCANVCLVKEGKYVGTVVEGPEYETACMFGPNLGVDNFACILRANQMCDELGVDTITTGSLIGVLMEAVERGLLSPADLDGVTPKWGDEEVVLEFVEKIAKREGVGDLLANGSRGLLEVWPQLKPIVSHVKGLEQSAYDGRAAYSMALGYGTSDIGAHHARAWTIARELEMGSDWDAEDRADIVIYHQTIRPLFDMLGVCRLPWIELGFEEHVYAEYYSAVTGIETVLDDLLAKSRAIYDLTRLINLGRGMTRADDYPPPRTFDTPVASGPNKGAHLSREEYDKLLDVYYAKRGWSSEGVPDQKVAEAFGDPLT